MPDLLPVSPDATVRAMAHSLLRRRCGARLAVAGMLLLWSPASRGTLVAQGTAPAAPASSARTPSVQAAAAGATSGQLTGAPPPPPVIRPGSPFSFVVLGHVRGDRHGPNPKLAELLERVRLLRPAFVVLTGDAIWGNVGSPEMPKEALHQQWAYLDSAFGTLRVPVYRVPGNHDISDRVSRDVYRERYGLPPHAVTVGNTRLLLLGSAWVPTDDDSRHHPYARPTDLDAPQKEWIRQELGHRDERATHTLVFVHHLLWWEPDSAGWWRDVHPLLAPAGVKAVFSGDYGPLKFSTTARDGVRYYQSSMEDSVSTTIQRGRIASRILSSQFDNFLQVHVSGPDVRVDVHIVAEVSSGQFTPERYAVVNEPLPPPPLTTRLITTVGRKRLAAAGAAVLILFAIGVLLGRASRRPT